MKKIALTVLLVVWVVCGVFNYGVTYAYFQGEFSQIAEETKGEDRAVAFFFGVLGPTVTLTVVFLSDFPKHGWRLN